VLSTREVPHPDEVRPLTRAAKDLPADAIVLSLRMLQLAEDLQRAYATHLLGRFGISAGRLSVLLLIERGDRSRPRAADLARRAGVSRPTMTRLLDGLARDGLVVRRADPDDGRARRIELTAAGRHLLQDIEPAHARRLVALTRLLSVEDRRHLDRLIERLRAGLGALTGA
jgi:DNA-binding MarR family transcriptional regulator